ncbi:hypothetical protein WJX72_004222 [[Myrmecia] bisecta]|uniref:Formin-like protein n=1 Tax=[Myrmecia] bisecta TaxID=41462 RepID=A0AAW1PXQ8_9CHLO
MTRNWQAPPDWKQEELLFGDNSYARRFTKKISFTEQNEPQQRHPGGARHALPPIQPSSIPAGRDRRTRGSPPPKWDISVASRASVDGVKSALAVLGPPITGYNHIKSGWVPTRPDGPLDSIHSAAVTQGSVTGAVGIGPLIRSLVVSSGNGCESVLALENAPTAVRRKDSWTTRSFRKNMESSCTLELKRRLQSDVTVKVTFVDGPSTPNLVRFSHATAASKAFEPIGEVKDTVWNQLAPVKLDVDFKSLEDAFAAKDVPKIKQAILCASGNAPEGTRLLTDEEIVGLLQCLPTPDEAKMLQKHSVEAASLGSVEQFMLEVMGIPLLDMRLNAARFETQFGPRLTVVQDGVDTLMAACDEVRTNKLLPTVLKIALAVGNFLNAGNRNGAAAGFQIETLLKLKEVRSTSTRSKTLLHFMARELCKHHPAFSLKSGLQACTAAAKLNLDTLKAEMADMRQNVRRIEQAIATLNSADDQAFKHAMEAFHTAAGRQLQDVEGKQAAALAAFKSLAAFLNGSPDSPLSSSPQQFFQLLNTFAQDLDAAQAENMANDSKAEKKAQRAQHDKTPTTRRMRSSMTTEGPLRKRDKVLVHIRAFARLKPEDRPALLTEKGARDRVRKLGLKQRDTTPANLPAAPEPISFASPTSSFATGLTLPDPDAYAFTPGVFGATTAKKRPFGAPSSVMHPLFDPTPAPDAHDLKPKQLDASFAAPAFSFGPSSGVHSSTLASAPAASAAEKAPRPSTPREHTPADNFGPLRASVEGIVSPNTAAQLRQSLELPVSRAHPEGSSARYDRSVMAKPARPAEALPAARPDAANDPLSPDMEQRSSLDEAFAAAGGISLRNSREEVRRAEPSRGGPAAGDTCTFRCPANRGTIDSPPGTPDFTPRLPAEPDVAAASISSPAQRAPNADDADARMRSRLPLASHPIAMEASDPGSDQGRVSASDSDGSDHGGATPLAIGQGANDHRMRRSLETRVESVDAEWFHASQSQGAPTANTQPSGGAQPPPAPLSHLPGFSGTLLIRQQTQHNQRGTAPNAASASQDAAADLIQFTPAPGQLVAMQKSQQAGNVAPKLATPTLQAGASDGLMMFTPMPGAQTAKQGRYAADQADPQERAATLRASLESLQCNTGSYQRTSPSRPVAVPEGPMGLAVRKSMQGLPDTPGSQTGDTPGGLQKQRRAKKFSGLARKIFGKGPKSGKADEPATPGTKAAQKGYSGWGASSSVRGFR